MDLKKRILGGVIGFLAFFLIVTYIGHISQPTEFSAISGIDCYTKDYKNKGENIPASDSYCDSGYSIPAKGGINSFCQTSYPIGQYVPKECYTQNMWGAYCYDGKEGGEQFSSWLDLSCQWCCKEEGLTAEQFSLGDTITKTLSVSTSKQVDTYYQDGNVLYLYGKWTLMKGKTEIDGGEKELSTNSYSHTLNKVFNTEGNYIFSVVLYSAESHYKNGAWTDYTFTKEDEEIYPFTVGYPEPPKPIWAQVIESFINGLKTIWDTITGWI